jgi:hypothetical protein
MRFLVAAAADGGSSPAAEMTMTALPVDTSAENELVAIAAELERYWSEQWRRAKEICDLLEQRLAAGAAARPELRLVGPPQTPPEADQPEQSTPALKLIDV